MIIRNWKYKHVKDLMGEWLEHSQLGDGWCCVWKFFCRLGECEKNFKSQNFDTLQTNHKFMHSGKK
jgi:hypothetical protein